MKQLFLGIDVGTSAMKLVLVDEQRNIRAQVTEKYSSSIPASGMNEIDPELWYESMKRGMARLLDGFDRTKVTGIGVTGQMHTLIVLDDKGKPIRPAIMWNDTRTKELVPYLKKRIAGFDEGRYLSKTISTGSPAANLYWLKKYEPENFGKIKKFLIGPDYLVYRLTGRIGTDYCEASTSCLYEIKGKRWSEQMRELIGLERSAYPELRGSSVPAGRISGETAEMLGLPDTVTVLTGTGDNPATAISTGCLIKGYPVVSLGTSGVFMMPVDMPDDKAKGKVILFSFDGNTFRYLVQGTVQSNGSTMDWWIKNIMKAEDYAVIDSCVDPHSQAANELIFYPHLMGEKTLYADPDIRGAFIGLGMQTGRRDMLYAVIEGLCFGLRELSEKMKLPIKEYGRLKVVGGGSRSSAWMQTLANVMDIRVEKMDGNVGPAYGIALLASCGESGISALSESEEPVRVDKCFEPDTEAAESCRRKYEKFLRIRGCLKYIETGECGEKLGCQRPEY